MTGNHAIDYVLGVLGGLVLTAVALLLERRKRWGS